MVMTIMIAMAIISNKSVHLHVCSNEYILYTYQYIYIYICMYTCETNMLYLTSWHASFAEAALPWPPGAAMMAEGDAATLTSGGSWNAGPQ